MQYRVTWTKWLTTISVCEVSSHFNVIYYDLFVVVPVWALDVSCFNKLYTRLQRSKTYCKKEQLLSQIPWVQLPPCISKQYAACTSVSPLFAIPSSKWNAEICSSLPPTKPDGTTPLLWKELRQDGYLFQTAMPAGYNIRV